MPYHTTELTDAHARLHKNHSYEFLVATWLMQDGWQVFAPLLDAAHAVDLIVSDGPKSYRIQIKSVESQDESCYVQNVWKGRHIDYVIYFAQRSNWGYVCPAFTTNRKKLDDPSHFRPVRVMLEAWQCLGQASASRVNEQRPLQTRIRITQPLQHLRPAVHPVHVRRLQGDTLPRILRRNGCPIALPAENTDR